MDGEEAPVKRRRIKTLFLCSIEKRNRERCKWVHDMQEYLVVKEEKRTTEIELGIGLVANKDLLTYFPRGERKTVLSFWRKVQRTT